MNWTEPQPPNDSIRYNHIILKSPIGKFIIDWKGWKVNPVYDIWLNDDLIGSQYSLDDSKEFIFNYIKNIHDKLGNLIKSA